MKDLRSQVLWALKKLQTKKTLKFHLELNFYNFQERKNGNILGSSLTIGIDITGFCVNIISELVFSIILHFFLLHILLEGEYYSFFNCDSFS